MPSTLTADRHEIALQTRFCLSDDHEPREKGRGREDGNQPS
jgi:hypothetical protein